MRARSPRLRPPRCAADGAGTPRRQFCLELNDLVVVLGEECTAATCPVMKATAVLLHAGRTTMVWQTTIRNSGDNSRVAIVTQTQIRLPAKAVAPSGKR